jgi:hypothetical protein
MKPKLFAVLLGGKPEGWTIETHNMFFGVDSNPEGEGLYPAIKRFWPAPPRIHIDAYTIIERIGNVRITPVRMNDPVSSEGDLRLFFVNLGGYRAEVHEEFHKKLFIVARNEAHAKEIAKRDPFFTEYDVSPHVDDTQALDEFGDEPPIDVNALVEPQGFRLVLKRIRSSRLVYPKPSFIGYRKIP